MQTALFKPLGHGDCQIDSVPMQPGDSAYSDKTTEPLGLLERKINWVANVRDTNPKGPVTIGGVLREIQTGQHAQAVKVVRDCPLDARRKKTHQNHASYQQAKGSLPAYLFGGEFTIRNKQGLAQASRVLVCDIDGKDNGLDTIEGAEACRESLRKNPHVLAAWISPSGDGVKCLVNIGEHAADAMGYEQAAKDAAEHFSDWNLDEACKDVCRLCFTSSDPGLWINENALPLPASSDEKQEIRSEPRKKRSATRHAAPREEDIEEALSCIHTRPEYHDWIRIVSAVGSALSMDKAISLLDKWSPEEKEGEYRRLLERPLEQIGIGTLFHFAKEHGYKPKRDPKKAHGKEDWTNAYVYSGGDDVFINIDTLNSLRPAAFNRFHKLDFREIRAEAADGEVRPQRISAERYALEVAKIPTVDRSDYLPQCEGIIVTTDNGTRLLNTYRPPSYPRKATEAEIGAVDQLIRSHLLFFCREAHACRLLHDYLAHTVQNPGEPKPWCIILKGIQGDGKSTLNEILQAAVGLENTAMVTPKILKDMFTSISTKSVFTRIEEVNLSEGKYDLLGQLKADIGTGRSVHRGMHREAEGKNVIASVIFTTNEVGALPITSGDRRFMVVESKWLDRDAAYKAGKNHFSVIYTFLSNIPDAFRQALLRHAISAEFVNAHQAPDTEAKTRFTEAAISSCGYDLKDWIERAQEKYPAFVNDSCVCIKAVKAWYNDFKKVDSTLANYPNDKRVNSALRELGYTELFNDTVSSGGKKSRVTIMHKNTKTGEEVAAIAKEWLKVGTR